MSRYFTVCKVNDRKVSDGGRFISNSPSGAAKKAGSRLMKKRGDNSVEVCVVETTRGGLGKEHRYKVKRVVVNKEVVHNGVVVLHKYKTVVKAL